MYLPIGTCPGGPKIMVTADDGLSWQPIQIKTDLKVSNHDLGLAIDSKNNLYATFESGGFVYYTASSDGGKLIAIRICGLPAEARCCSARQASVST